ncbi:uncharacterized protein LOC124881569 [Girardinichthys multiradiatus]|uniref:uncharacterized protein LOC124881569 n=1 Tax=Girardinichthys multiradiatus TaxID=208333 RepID=UPI001FAC32B1|nr:uncharacterized protein LOC124881569 [Girardinichthys multiradiatus]XP_047243143.1 uncharacterized protein LOC124881569 [Girardinichthys multiradiatus]
MEESRWRKMLVFFILLLQFTGALSRNEDLFLFFTVKAGDNVTLPCKNVAAGHRNCDTTVWIYSKLGQTAVELIYLGQVKQTTSDRLSVSADCSLVLKKVTAEDVGRYTCRQYISGTQSGPDAGVHLSLVKLTEHQNQDRVTLNCSVLTDEQCKHTVKWLFKGKDVNKDNQELKESSSSCSAAFNFQTSHYTLTSRFNWFSCEVKTRYDKVQLFNFSSRSSDRGKTSATTEPTFASPENPVPAEHSTDWWRFLLGSVGLAALIAAVGIINIWTRTKGRKTHLDENPVCLDEDDGPVNYENIRTSTV